MKCLLVILLCSVAICQTGCLCCQRIHVLSLNECEETARAVDLMLGTPYYRAPRVGTEIPPAFWPPEVRKLHPLAVYTHMGNALIVISRDAKKERGYCVMPLTSSNYPTVEQDGWVWQGLGERVYSYRKDLSKLGPSETIINDSPEFRAVEGKSFVVLKECYVVRCIGEKDTYPFVVTEHGMPGFPDDPRKYVGKRLNDIKILGVLPKETVFTVVQRRRVRNEDGTQTRFDIAPVGSLQKKWRILDGLLL